jgi:Grx4 family monothiol glutaredoxin
MSADKTGLISVTSVADFDAVHHPETKMLFVVHFFAPWAPQCQQIDDVLIELSRDSTVASSVKFLKVEAESLPEISNQFNITAVPTCILLKSGMEVDRVNGVKASELSAKVKLHAGGGESSTSLNDRLKKLINTAPVMVFMKGTPDQPRCGFSRTLVQILNDCKAKFSSFDILQDESVRQGLKEYSNWPTFPQVYINGELVGGLDIVKELVASGEFQTMLPPSAAAEAGNEAGGSRQLSLEDRLKALISRDPVMLFMKGSPESPKCGFSRSIIAILNEKHAKYGHFDILEDEEVRQGLKTFSNWPTYPQLYIKGELVGGLDIVKELNQSGELESMLNTATN